MCDWQYCFCVFRSAPFDNVNIFVCQAPLCFSFDSRNCIGMWYLLNLSYVSCHISKSINLDSTKRKGKLVPAQVM